MSKTNFVGQMKHLRAIRAAMGADMVSVPVGLMAGLRHLIRLEGLGAALVSPFGAAPFDLKPYVERNLLRRRIRFPRLFGNFVAAAFYRTALQMRARLSVALLIAEFKRHPQARALVYNGFLMPDSLTGAVADHLGRGKLVVEKGFFPKTLQCDRNGINFGSTLPRDPGFYRSLPASVGTRLPEDIGRRRTKLRGKQVDDLPDSYVFVPMQVPSDMQVLEHSPWISGMTQLYGVIARLANSMPELNFVVKEHPSFPLSIRKHVLPHPRIVFANRNDTRELIEAADAVITINSTAGLESLLLGKRVVTLGDAPYNIKGIVRMASGENELLRVMGELPGWQPDEALREAFLRYVYNVFLLPGNIDNPKPFLLEAIRRRAEGNDEHAAFIAALRPDHER
ncbi:nitrogen fixation protein FixF [Rhizobium sp. KAs_5_22]|uniref:capsular polysaccharide export protein, LipB/KpsS family n=1 Tax=Ciceribacter selenitireducens TaxID=448181 RepID=UPI000A05BB33|nr:hypothetical protein [Ciceribacter selenitireducens]PPJ46040.1 nitrogen fixation protein FixF [Rhizobium sp. KAs_5_22]